MLRYDTPDIGLASVAVSVGNDDRVSARVKLSTVLGGTTIGVQLASLREHRYMERVSKETIGAQLRPHLRERLHPVRRLGQGVTGHGKAKAVPAEYDSVCSTMIASSRR